ncbi:MAG: methyltransferase [Campylobacterales bacterium]|nr:methyltransferase [Campylobacterales bacterium]
MNTKNPNNQNVIKEFSRFSKDYNSYNQIQAQVAKQLIDKLPRDHYTAIADIGCGTGALYDRLINSEISFERLMALDASEQMLLLHPRSKKVITQYFDFNKSSSFASIKDKFDLVLSSSALQWSKDLDWTISQLAHIGDNFYGAIFTSNTFKTIHETASVSSPICTADDIKEAFDRSYKDTQYEIYRYKLYFDSKKELFNYIKKSGVSGGEQKLNYKQTKTLMREYPLDCLEFEVLFVEASN